MYTLQAFSRFAWLFALPAAFSVQIAFAQRGGSGVGSGGTTSTGAGPTTGPSTGRSTGLGTGTNSTTPNSTLDYPNQGLNRPVFLSGRVVLDDGSKPSPDIAIQRVCNGNPHTETHTDSKGRFSFQFGSSTDAAMDASESSVGLYPGQPGAPGSAMNNGGYGETSATRGINNNYLQRCQIQASYPGYRSDLIDLFQRHALDNPDLGVIVLHRIGGIQGTAVSVTTELAPKKAKKEYQKAQQLQAKGDVEGAKERLEAAVEEYPKFALAWYDLGRLEQSAKDPEARKSYEAALVADSKYVNPYDALAELSAQESKWQEAADRSKQAVELNPVEFPSSWFYNAFANYKLKNYAVAEKSAKEVVKLDGSHKYPQIETLLAQLCADHGDYTGAAQHLQAYLQLQPNSPNAAELKQQLAKLQETAAQMKK
jgi:tetratricopeptide (TPR) repeat protein